MAEELTRDERLVVLAFDRGNGAQLSEDELVDRSSLDRPEAVAAAERLQASGLLVKRAAFWRLTDKGVDVFGGLTNTGRP